MPLTHDTGLDTRPAALLATRLRACLGARPATLLATCLSSHLDRTVGIKVLQEFVAIDPDDDDDDDDEDEDDDDDNNEDSDGQDEDEDEGPEEGSGWSD